jgi:hypothetical protein
MTNDEAWQLMVDLLGTTRSGTRYPAHVEISNPEQAGELARAILQVERKGEQLTFEKWWNESDDIANDGPWEPDTMIQFAWAGWQARGRGEQLELGFDRVGEE